MARSLALFAAWAVVGFVASWALLYGFTPAGPPILLVVWLAYRYLPRRTGTCRPEAYGAFAGFGGFCLVLASSLDGDPSPFAAAGAVAIALSFFCYLAAGRRRCVGRSLAG